MAKTNAELIALIQDKLEEAIATPQINYQVGQKRFDYNGYVDYLMDMKERLEQSATPEEHVTEFAIDIDEFGADNSEEMT